MRDKVGLLSGIAGIITALAALFAVFMSDAGDRADKADSKSEVTFSLLKQQFDYVEKDLSNLRDTQSKQNVVLNDLSQQLAVLKAQLEMFAQARRHALSVPSVRAKPAITTVSQARQAPELPETLEKALEDAQ